MPFFNEDLISLKFNKRFAARLARCCGSTFYSYKIQN